MTRIRQQVSIRPPTDMEGLLPYVQRESHPLLRAMRTAVNEIADVAWQRSIWVSSADEYETVVEVEVQPGRTVFFSADIVANDGSGNGVLRKVDGAWRNDGSSISLVFLTLDTGTLNLGTTPAGVGDAKVEPDGDNMTVQVKGNGTDRWTWTVVWRSVISWVEADLG